MNSKKHQKMQNKSLHYPEVEATFRMISSGKIQAKDFPKAEAFFQELYQNTPPEEIPKLTHTLHTLLGEEALRQTLAGFAYRKPHGYAGDFEIIDKTYRQEQHPDPRFAIWDQFHHATTAARAVRNRKTYFKQLLAEVKRPGQPLQVLNVASGPGRDMFEWYEETGDRTVFFDCVDLDGNAIDYARTLNQRYLYNLHFNQQNIFRFRPQRKYRLIWSAGLFDYFSDEVFVRILRRMKDWVYPGGSIVVGNFSTYNPSQGYMILLTDWPLLLRSESKLTDLALQAGFKRGAITVESEPEGVNLFLRLNPAKFNGRSQV